MPNLTWHVHIDWDNDDSYAYEEAEYVTKLSIERGRDDQWAEFRAGKATLTLDNSTDRFDPWNAASALYPNILPQRGIKILLEYSGTTYPLFVGKLEDVVPAGRRGDKTVTLTALDGYRDLVGATATLALQTAKRTDEAIDLILTDIGWPAGARNLDAGSDLLAYWWCGDQSAAQSILELCRSENGLFLVTNDGKARFVSRHGVLTGGSLGTIDEDIITDIELTSPWENIRNDIRVKSYPIYLAATGTLWQLQDTGVNLGPGESIVFWAGYQDSNRADCSAQNVITPVATTDYAANAQQDGLGADMTASMGVAASKMSRTAKLTVTNNHATDWLWITLLKVRGDALVQTPNEIRLDDAASQLIYGPRVLDLDTNWQQSLITAGDYARFLRQFYATPRKRVVIEMEQRLPEMVQFELFDRLLFTSPLYGISELMRLGSLKLTSGDTMQTLMATMGLEPSDNTVYWQVGVVGHAEMGVTTSVGY